MNPNTKREVVRKLEAVARMGIQTFGHGARKTKFIVQSEVGMCFRDEAADLYEEIIELVWKAGDFRHKFSRGYIDNALAQLVAHLLDEGDTVGATDHFEKLLSDLEAFSVAQRVYLPLDGVCISDDVKEIELGQVVLRRLDTCERDEICTTMKSIVDGSAVSDEQKPRLLEASVKTLDENLVGKVCAVVKVVAEPRRARERAEEEVRGALDLLRYAIPALHLRAVKVEIGLQGEAPSTARHAIVLSEELDKLHALSELVGPHAALELSSRTIDRMREIGVFEMGSVLAKEEDLRTSYEKALLHSLHWFADSQTQLGTANKLLSLIVSLEALFTPKDARAIATSVAEGVALVIGSDLQTKKEIVTTIKRFYRDRSALSHGKKKVIPEFSIGQLTEIVGSVIMTLIQRKGEFESLARFHEWIEDMKLDVVPPPGRTNATSPTPSRNMGPSRLLTAVLVPEEDLYVAHCVEVGTVSQGATVGEALASLKEATELYLEESPLPESGCPLFTTFEVGAR